MNIVLIGFSGSGKSAVGRLLAQRLGWSFVDTDVEVERRAGRRIHEIFARDGEAAFRRFEAESVRQALQSTRTVVSVGGGAVVDPANREAVRRGNLVVLLDAGVETLQRRLALAEGDEPRPMLGKAGPEGVAADADTRSATIARITSLKGVRDPIYRSTAHVVVSTEGVGLEEAAARVFEAVQGALGDEAVTKVGP